MGDWPAAVVGSKESPKRPDWAMPIEQWLRPGAQGLYFLWRGQKLVYVGMSMNIQQRIKSHIAAKTCDFTHFTFSDLSQCCPDDQNMKDFAERLESMNIDMYRPEGNRALRIVR